MALTDLPLSHCTTSAELNMSASSSASRSADDAGEPWTYHASSVVWHGTCLVAAALRQRTARAAAASVVRMRAGHREDDDDDESGGDKTVVAAEAAARMVDSIIASAPEMERAAGMWRRVGALAPVTAAPWTGGDAFIGKYKRNNANSSIYRLVAGTILA